MNASICRVAVSTSGKSARLRHLRLRMENHTSMKLSQEAWTGKKWKTKVRSGWASNQVRTSAEWWELTGSRIRWIGWPPGVSRSSRPSSSQHSHERCWSRTRPHTLAIVDAEAGQQVDRAVADVLELTAGRPPRGRRLVRHGRSAHADARLVVDAEQRAILRRAQQQVDDGHRLVHEPGVPVVHPGLKGGPGGACGA